MALFRLGFLWNGGRLIVGRPCDVKKLVFVQQLISQSSSITAKCWEKPRGQCFGIPDGPEAMLNFAKPKKKPEKCERISFELQQHGFKCNLEKSRTTEFFKDCQNRPVSIY